MRDAWRLAVGTLTRVPVPAPRTIDRRVAGRAMLLAPVIGAVLAIVVGVLAQLVADRLPATASDLVVAAIAIGALAFATRGIHLDGLADTADALGSGRSAAGALEVARRSDIGPFGVVTVVLVLLVQVAAFAGLVGDGRAALGLVIAAGTARLSLVLACARGVPAARDEGLGATVAGSVPVAAAVAVTALWLLGCVAVTAALTPGAVLSTVLAIVGSLLLATFVVRTCVRRFGGIAGDVLGSLVELSFAAALVILVAVPS